MKVERNYTRSRKLLQLWVCVSICRFSFFFWIFIRHIEAIVSWRKMAVSSDLIIWFSIVAGNCSPNDQDNLSPDAFTRNKLCYIKYESKLLVDIVRGVKQYKVRWSGVKRRSTIKILWKVDKSNFLGRTVLHVVCYLISYVAFGWVLLEPMLEFGMLVVAFYVVIEIVESWGSDRCRAFPLLTGQGKEICMRKDWASYHSPEGTCLRSLQPGWHAGNTELCITAKRIRCFCFLER